MCPSRRALGSIGSPDARCGAAAAADADADAEHGRGLRSGGGGWGARLGRGHLVRCGIAMPPSRMWVTHYDGRVSLTKGEVAHQSSGPRSGR
eukprot:359264-Chlamydomonas_euryale.AAC.1